MDVDAQSTQGTAAEAALDGCGPLEVHAHKIIDAIPTVAWSARPGGWTEFLNRRWHDYTGLSVAQGLGWGWKAAIHPDDLGGLTAAWQALLAKGEPGETEARLRRSDGAHRWFLFRVEPVRDDAGQVLRWYGTATDIDDRKRAESLRAAERRTLEMIAEALRRSEAELRRITDLIPQSVHVLARDGRTLYANRVSLEYTGVSVEDGAPADYRRKVFHPDDLERLAAERERGLSGEVPFELELRARRHDGIYRWFLVRYNPFRDEEGRVVRWYATGTDIHERKQAEERIRKENLALREEIDGSSMFEEIVGSSDALRVVLSQVAKVAPTDSTVLIAGETGTGKELVARAIHAKSKRAGRAFVRVHLAAIPQALIGSELFGHEKGAFSGALQRRIGRFESADGGTLLLDEVGELPAETQVALLRVLQEREFERVGSSEPIPVDVRVLAATNRDLKAAVANGTFREDLYYRLNVFPITVPSLRERADDIPLLVEYLVERSAKGAGKKIRRIEKRSLDLFKGYGWPGNVRELQNVIERAVIRCESDTLSVDETWFKHDPPSSPPDAESLNGSLAGREREMIEAALKESKGRVAGPFGAAARLGVPRQTLDSKIAALGINKSRFKT